jgi:hypothetical protein
MGKISVVDSTDTESYSSVKRDDVGTAKGLSTKTQKHTQKQIEIFKPDDDISTRDGET